MSVSERNWDALEIKIYRKEAFTSKTKQILFQAHKMHISWVDLKHIGAVKQLSSSALASIANRGTVMGCIAFIFWYYKVGSLIPSYKFLLRWKPQLKFTTGTLVYRWGTSCWKMYSQKKMACWEQGDAFRHQMKPTVPGVTGLVNLEKHRVAITTQ